MTIDIRGYWPRSLLVAAATVLATAACTPPPPNHPRLPTRRVGVLAAAVDSALQLRSDVTCNAVPLDKQEDGIEPATGCFLNSKDSTLFYFYVAKTGEVLAWGRDSHVPDSTRAQALRAIARHNDSLYGPGQVCPPTERGQGFTVWPSSGHFFYAYADPDAAKLELPHNIYEGARLGSPRCTFGDWVSVPFLG